jgi:hypothetical protein
LYSIRNGKPEEKTRIQNQIFATYPENQFVSKVIKNIVKNIQKYVVKEDYDILYIGANALVSTIYDKSDKKYLNLLSLSKSKSIVQVTGKGSWRTDKSFLF